jgi:hypothetical protein
MSRMRKKQVCPGVILFTNFNQFGDFGVYLESDGKLLLLSEGEFDYFIENISEDEAYRFVDFCDDEPEEWFDYFSEEDDPFTSVYDRESFAEALKEYGILPEGAKVYCDLEAEQPLHRFIRDLIREMY